MIATTRMRKVMLLTLLMPIEWGRVETRHSGMSCGLRRVPASWQPGRDPGLINRLRIARPRRQTALTLLPSHEVEMYAIPVPVPRALPHAHIHPVIWSGGATFPSSVVSVHMARQPALRSFAFPYTAATAIKSALRHR